MGKKKGKGNQDDHELFAGQQADGNKNYISLAKKAQLEAEEANIGGNYEDHGSDSDEVRSKKKNKRNRKGGDELGDEFDAE